MMCNAQRNQIGILTGHISKEYRTVGFTRRIHRIGTIFGECGFGKYGDLSFPVRRAGVSSHVGFTQSEIITIPSIDADQGEASNGT